MNRRKFLTFSALGVQTIAGCVGENDIPDTTTTAPSTRTSKKDEETSTTTNPITEDSTTTGKPPEFQLVKVRSPNKAEIGDQVSFKFTVKNAGGRLGVFETTISRKNKYGNWETSEPWTRSIESGGTATLESQNFTVNYLRKITFRIDAFGHEFSIKFVAPKLAFGERYKYQNKYKVSVESVTFRKSFKFSTNGNEHTHEPGAGEKFADVQVWSTQLPNSDGYSLSKYSFDITADNTIYKAKSVELREEGKFEAGSGRITYEIPESISKSDLRVMWSRKPTDLDVFRAYWRSGN